MWLSAAQPNTLEDFHRHRSLFVWKVLHVNWLVLILYTYLNFAILYVVAKKWHKSMPNREKERRKKNEERTQLFVWELSWSTTNSLEIASSCSLFANAASPSYSASSSESSSLLHFLLFMIFGTKRVTSLVSDISSPLFTLSNRTALTFLAFPASICTEDKGEGLDSALLLYASLKINSWCLCELKRHKDFANKKQNSINLEKLDIDELIRWRCFLNHKFKKQKSKAQICWTCF